MAFHSNKVFILSQEDTVLSALNGLWVLVSFWAISVLKEWLSERLPLDFHLTLTCQTSTKTEVYRTLLFNITSCLFTNSYFNISDISRSGVSFLSSWLVPPSGFFLLGSQHLSADGCYQPEPITHGFILGTSFSLLITTQERSQCM